MGVPKHFQAVWLAPIVVLFLSVSVNFVIERYYDYRETLRGEREYAKKQLHEFYFPLQHLLQTSKSQWDEYRRRYGERERFLDIRRGEPNDAMRQWQLYMISTFQPLHAQMESLLINQAGLALKTPEMKEYLHQLLAHISAYKTLFAKWRVDDTSEQFAYVSFPDGLESVVGLHIEQLREKVDSDR